MTRACVFCVAWGWVLAAVSGAAADAQPMQLRAYALLRYGQLGSARLETPVAQLTGTPEPSFALGGRGELTVLRYLSVGLELMMGELRADLHHQSNEHINGASFDFGVLVSPRLPLFSDRLELRAQLLGGFASRFVEGYFPFLDPNRVIIAEDRFSSLNPYYGAGIGFTAWLSANLGAFLELNVVQRYTRATVRPWVPNEFLPLEPDRRSAPIELSETHGFVVIGFGYREAP